MKYYYKKYFPFKTPRKEQDEAIKFALKSFIEEDKRFVILEMPTGTGKSGCALTISKFLQNHYRWTKKQSENYKVGAYFLTTQRLLQDQYENDFGPPHGDMQSIKSATNYKCHYLRGNTCSEGLQLLKETKADSPFKRSCGNGNCKYLCQKRFFLESMSSITNFPYFLTETTHVGGIAPRKVLVIDEAHNLESEIGKHVEVVISENFANRILKIDMPNTQSMKRSFDWVKEKYREAIVRCLNEYLEKQAELVDVEGRSSENYKKLLKQTDKIQSHLSKVDNFIRIYDKNNWIFNVIEPQGMAGRKFEFKPIDIGEFAEKFVFRYGAKVLLMSATILNKEAYCESIGVNPKDVAFISLDSPFPTENRPIYFLPAGKMNMNNIDKSLPKMKAIITDILSVHNNEKGIIHCRTFKIARYIKNNIKSNRLLIHSTENKDFTLKEHLTSDKPTVFISPSSTEGLDLKGNLSRFQVVCKIYWPYLGDKLVLARKQKHKRWYAYQAAKAIVQSLGRSIRNENDHAVSYILDESWESFYRNNQDLFPNYFKKALQ